jgi:hypothetical protein
MEGNGGPPEYLNEQDKDGARSLTCFGLEDGNFATGPPLIGAAVPE